MILPVTYTSVLILLLACLFCLGTWINTFKATSPKWRFELFAMDFAVGALLLAIVAAYTLGSLGSDLPFSDRMLVAGKTSEALAIMAGAVFNLGNMFLLASVSLIGIATAFPLCFGLAILISSCFYFRTANVYYFIAGGVLIVFTILLELRAAGLRDAVTPAKKPFAPRADSARTAANEGSATSPLRVSSPSNFSGQSQAKKRAAKKPRSRRVVRGIVAGLIGGAALGFLLVLLQNSVGGDIGLGPYAAMLLFGIGVLASTIVYNFYFLNITIEGQPLTFLAYFKGTKGQHALGILGGAMFMGGLLAATIAIESSGPAEMPKLLQFLLPLLSVPLAVVYAAVLWKELRVPAKSRRALLLASVLFLCSLGLFAYGFNVS